MLSATAANICRGQRTPPDAITLLAAFSTVACLVPALCACLIDPMAARWIDKATFGKRASIDDSQRAWSFDAFSSSGRKSQLVASCPDRGSSRGNRSQPVL